MGISTVSAQKIKGLIIDAATLEPIENAKIFDINSEVAVFSNANGSFEIAANSFPASLKVSALNYTTQIVSLESFEPSIEIYLKNSSEQLSEVVINSTLIPNSLQRTPAAISVIDEKDLSKVDRSNFVQVLNTVPGIYVNQGALNTTKLNIRGIGARSQYSTNRIQA